MKNYGIDTDQWNKIKGMIESHQFFNLESIPHLTLPEQITSGGDSPAANTKAIKIYHSKRDLKGSILNLGYILEMLHCEYDFSHFQEAACIHATGKCKDADNVQFEVHVYVDDTTDKVSFEFIRTKASQIRHYYEVVNRIVRKLNI